MNRTPIPFCEDIGKRCIEHPEGAAWGWFDHPQYKKIIVWLYCPECRNSSGCLTRHTITDNGEVNASIQCPSEGCTWHIWGILEEYKENGGVAQPYPLKNG